MKRGQTTLFTILGILLLLGVLLYMASVYAPKPEEEVKKQVTVTAEDQPIKSFVDSCVLQTARMALFFFGFVGGDVEPPAYKTFFMYDARYKIPYVYYEGATQYVTIDLVEKTLAQYVDAKLKKCTIFSGFSGIQVTDAAPRTKVQLLDNEVVFSITYPVHIERDGKKNLVGPEWSARIPLRLKEMTEITNRIVERKHQDPSLIHWDYLTEITTKNYNATAYTEVNSTIVYRLVDEKNELLGEPYIFQFAVRIK